MTFKGTEIHGPADTVGVNGPFQAVAICGERSGRNSEFGLYGEDGLPLPNCDIAGDLFTSTPRKASPGEEPVATCDVPVLFAGGVPQQFGHVILNSLGRLWALDKLPEATALLYLPRRFANISSYPYLVPLLELLGVQTQVFLHQRTTLYRCLYTAKDLFGERHGGAMDPLMRAWISQRLPPKGPITKGRKVYFTRSQLGPKVGRYCNEELLEQLLAADGYEIVAPERLSLSEQVTVMQDAETLLFAESSALHLYGLVQRSGQSAGVIQRRRSLPALIERQLEDGPVVVHAIDAISSVYWPAKRRDNLSLATLEFNRLRDLLSAARLLSPTARWRAPYAPETAASLHAGLAPGERLLSEQERQTWLRDRRKRKHA